MIKSIKYQKKSEVKTNPWTFALYIGFYAGIIWGALKIIEYFLKFTTLVPGFLVESFYKHQFLTTWQGYIVGWVYFTLFSMLSALLYMVFLRKIKGPWVGIGYGLFWWCLLYLLIGPLTGMMKWPYYMDLNTILTDICLFILWGLFIGFSITVEYTDERNREPNKG